MRAFLALFVPLSLGCGRLAEPAADAGDAGSDAVGDAALADARQPCDAATAFDDPCSWTTFDLSSLGLDAGVQPWGGTFDGKYVYFAPNPGGPGSDSLVVRVDTSEPFDSAASWSTFDVAALGSNVGGFAGSSFDGRYVYLVPLNGQDAGVTGMFTRYDTAASFMAAPSWSVFDVTISNTPALPGFAGAVFDGRYIYFVPAGPSGYWVVRYDTTSSFGAASSWASMAPSTEPDFNGALFDGRYVYFVPGPDNFGIILRYDTTASFTTKASWLSFDLTTIAPYALTFSGGAFDGRYVYLVAGTQPLVFRYDTKAPFDSAASWATFDLTQVDPGVTGWFSTAGYDGRYLYWAESSSAIVTRFDTTGAFTSTTSWSSFDVSHVNAEAMGFIGAIFDGQYMYLVPEWPIAARYRARASPALPKLPGWNGSFF